MPTSRPRWRAMSATSWSSTTSAIRRSRSRSGAGAMENQHVASGDTPHPKLPEHRLHHAMRTGNLMFAGCWMSGLSPSSTSATSPSQRHCRATNTIRRTRSRHHTFLGLPHTIGGKKIAGLDGGGTLTTRGPDHGKPHGPFRTWDVTDPTQPKLLSTIELPDFGDALRHQRGPLRHASASRKGRHRQSGLRHLVRGRASASWTSTIRLIRRSAATSSRSPAPAPPAPLHQ